MSSFLQVTVPYGSCESPYVHDGLSPPIYPCYLRPRGHKLQSADGTHKKADKYLLRLYISIISTLLYLYFGIPERLKGHKQILRPLRERGRVQQNQLISACDKEERVNKSGNLTYVICAWRLTLTLVKCGALFGSIEDLGGLGQH